MTMSTSFNSIVQLEANSERSWVRVPEELAVESGLMIGQFHPCCDERAVRNADFNGSRSTIYASGRTSGVAGYATRSYSHCIAGHAIGMALRRGRVARIHWADSAPLTSSSLREKVATWLMTNFSTS
jgi:hypothetical protein